MDEYTPNLKRCKKCGVEKPTSEFKKDPTYTCGLRGACKDCERIRSKEYNKAYRVANREKLRAIDKAYRQNNPDVNRAACRAYNKAHRDRRRIIEKAQRDKNPERYRSYAQNRRAKRRASGGKFTASQIAQLYKLQKGRCWWDVKHSLDEGYHIDHRIPLAKGGTNDISNIVLTCPFCNLSKGAKLPDEFAGRLL